MQNQLHNHRSQRKVFLTTLNQSYYLDFLANNVLITLLQSRFMPLELCSMDNSISVRHFEYFSAKFKNYQIFITFVDQIDLNNLPIICEKNRSTTNWKLSSQEVKALQVAMFHSLIKSIFEFHKYYTIYLQDQLYFKLFNFKFLRKPICIIYDTKKQGSARNNLFWHQPSLLIRSLLLLIIPNHHDENK